MDVQLFDTTLRDGTQSEGLSLSVEDKLKITRLLDGFGIHFIEGGYPGSNPKDVEFFQRAKSLHLKHAKLTAFGMTRKAGGRADSDPVLRALVDAQTPVVCIVGKSWNLHVTAVLGTTLEENLAMISDSVGFLKAQGKRSSTTPSTSSTASAPIAATRWRRSGRPPRPAPTGSRCVTPTAAACRVRSATSSRRCARRCRRAWASTPTTTATSPSPTRWPAVEAGCTQVQGTINGWGERCGNANLISIIPALQLKMERRCVPDENLAQLTELSRAVSEIANIRPRAHAPYVGRSAFAHKGGMHVAAVEKVTHSYEHVPPERVGNRRHIVVSELAGRGNVRMRRSSSASTCRGTSARCWSGSRTSRARATSSRRPTGRSSCSAGAASPATRRRSRCWTSSSSPSGGAATRCSPRRPSS